MGADFSARLSQEIRIKRGLSQGACSRRCPNVEVIPLSDLNIDPARLR